LQLVGTVSAAAPVFSEPASKRVAVFGDLANVAFGSAAISNVGGNARTVKRDLIDASPCLGRLDLGFFGASALIKGAKGKNAANQQGEFITASGAFCIE
jgi:hypothetical protein